MPPSKPIPPRDLYLTVAVAVLLATLGVLIALSRAGSVLFWASHKGDTSGSRVQPLQLAGVLCLLAGGLKLGFVANFLSKPVIVGFMHGLALVIAAAQLPKLLGLKPVGETTRAGMVGCSAFRRWSTRGMMRSAMA